ncbi:MAG: hypothetical protein P4L33_02490 [Capsulimonadaceae bacterium]|nr:hypothetical protein [Capsulimonadaceae bacterium]
MRPKPSPCEILFGALCRFLLLALLVTFSTGAFSAVSSASQPRHVTLIVCPGLTYDTLYAHFSTRDLPFDMAEGLLSPGNARKPDPVANLYATLYAGDTANTKNPNRTLLMRLITAADPPGRVMVVPSATVDEAGLIARSGMQQGDLVILCGLPPVNPRTHEWNRLPVALIGDNSHYWGHKTLTSDTTQTAGLVALRDIAPTALSYAGIAIPGTMSGHVIAGELSPDSNDSLLYGMDRLAHLNQLVLLPSMWAWGGISLVALLTSLWSLSKGITLRPALQRYLLRVMAGTPLALMLAAIPVPANAWSYGLTILGVALLLGAIPRMDALMTLTAAAIAVDGLTGSPMVSRSALSGYWISGIRFYGIGNEYMGILLGGALVSAYAAAKRWPEGIRSPKGAALLGLWFALVLFVLSYPAFGAKAGGAVTAMAAFAPAWFALVRGQRIDWRICAMSAVAGFALVFVWAALASLTGGRSTHIQAAAAHASHGDIGYIWHIAVRKAKMAFLTATVPGVIATYIGLVPVWFLWRKTALKDRVREFLSTDPALAAVMRAAAAGSIAALLFNDSGFVPFVLIFAALCWTLLHEMLGRADQRGHLNP